MLSIDVVNDWLAFPLLGISKLHYAHTFSGAIEAIKEFTLHLIPMVNALRREVYELIRSIPSKGTNKFFHEKVTFCSCIVIGFDEMGNMLFQISLFIEWLKL